GRSARAAQQHRRSAAPDRGRGRDRHHDAWQAGRRARAARRGATPLVAARRADPAACRGASRLGLASGSRAAGRRDDRRARTARAMTPSRGLLDTSVLIANESGRPLDLGRLPNEVAVSAVTIAELYVGVLAARDVDARARRLATLEAT